METTEDYAKWLEAEKGANEVEAKYIESETWYDAAFNEWELQDGLKTSRVAVANAEAAAEAREFAALYRSGKIANAQYELAVLGGELTTIREEMTRL
jgi:hypothetical protein